ncbi:hypothetical protein B566_EDAN014259 [Ephemera danica]|nr:hypothetical protein B566_EDAN014259 [Ephemera danica]
MKCLEDGTFETMDFSVFCNARNYTMDVEVSGRKLKVTYGNNNFTEQCEGGIIQAPVKDLCNEGQLNLNAFSLCGMYHLHSLYKTVKLPRRLE